MEGKFSDVGPPEPRVVVFGHLLLESCFTAVPEEETLLSNLEQWILRTNTWNVSPALALIVTASISSTFFRALFGESSALVDQAEVHLCSFRNSVWH
jgi:hypothetical protein